MANNKKVIVVIPAYNTERTLERTIKAIPDGSADEILVVDDGSRDRTAEIARSLGATVITHGKNRGYGAAQKTGYREALARGADVAVMVHSDFQYDPTLVPQMTRSVLSGTADVCFGSRMVIKKNARAGGMPLWRFVANIALTIIEDSVLRLGLTEYHTGYRAYGRDLLLAIPFEKNSDNYVFDTEMFAEISIGRFRVSEIPIPTRYLADSQSPNFSKCVVYGLSTLGVLIKFILHRTRLTSYPQFIVKK